MNFTKSHKILFWKVCWFHMFWKGLKIWKNLTIIFDIFSNHVQTFWEYFGKQLFCFDSLPQQNGFFSYLRIRTSKYIVEGQQGHWRQHSRKLLRRCKKQVHILCRLVHCIASMYLDYIRSLFRPNCSTKSQNLLVPLISNLECWKIASTIYFANFMILDDL